MGHSTIRHRVLETSLAQAPRGRQIPPHTLHADIDCLKTGWLLDRLLSSSQKLAGQPDAVGFQDSMSYCKRNAKACKIKIKTQARYLVTCCRVNTSTKSSKKKQHPKTISRFIFSKILTSKIAKYGLSMRDSMCAQSALTIRKGAHRHAISARSFSAKN